MNGIRPAHSPACRRSASGAPPADLSSDTCASGCFALVFLACDDGPKTEEPDPWVDPIDGGYQVDALTCDFQPSPRKHHIVTTFVTPGLLTYNEGSHTRSTERGLLVLGGEALNGAPLDDLWLFDLSRPWLECRWTRLHDNMTGWDGVADGSLVFDEATGSFQLVGGRHKPAGSGWKPLTSVLTLTDLDTTFLSTGSLPVVTDVRVASVGSPICQGTVADCICMAPACGNAQGTVQHNELVARYNFGTGTVPSHRRAACDQSHESWGSAATPDIVCNPSTEEYPGACSIPCPIVEGYLSACDPDPYCANDAVTAWVSGARVGLHVEEHTYPGRSEAASAWDPVSQELALFGGTVGCTDTACGSSNIDDLLDDDGTTRNSSLAAANSGSLARVEVNGAVTLIDDLPFDEDWNDDHPPPGDPTIGVRAGSAAFLGVYWDQASKEWFGSPSLVTWGGTFQQDVAPTRSLDVVNAVPYDQSSTLFWPEVRMEPNEDPLWFLTSDTLREVDVLTGEITPVGLIPAAYDGAMAPLDEDTLVVIGGVARTRTGFGWSTTSATSSTRNRSIRSSAWMAVEIPSTERSGSSARSGAPPG